MQKPKKIPQRMCIACREMKDKKEMFRVVKTASGEIVPDKSGNLSGRGAYVCASPECIKKLKKYRLLHKTFSCNISDEVYAAVEEGLLADDGK
jgi:hypothetical protein